MQHSDGGQQQEGHVVMTTTPSMAALSAITTSHPAVTQLRVTGRVPVVTASAAVGVVAAGQQAVLTTVAGAHPVAVAPQAVMVPTQTVSHLLTPATCLSANTVQIPATLNVLQRQLSAPGVVGLSTVQDLQQVLQQASQQPITLLTTTDAVADPQQHPRLARPLSFPHASSSSSSLPPVSSMSATGATIHHHGQSPVRGAVPVMAATLSHSNLQHSLLGMNLNPQQQQQLGAAQRRVVTAAVTTTTNTIAVIPATNITAQSRTVSEVRAPSGQPPSLKTASGVSPRKKMRLEEKQPPNPEVANYRKQLVELKHKQMKELKAEYFENLTEMFFLQSGQNLMDYHTWKKRPTPQLVNFLKSGKLDSDEEEDVLQVKEINSEVKVLTNPGSNVPLATPVAISTTLPPMVSALSQQGSEHRSSHRGVCLPGFSHSLSAAFSVVAPSAQTVSAGSSTSTTTATVAMVATSSTTASSSSHLHQLSQGPDAKSAALKGQTSPLKQVKSQPLSPGQRLHTRQQSLSAVYDNLSGSSQEVIVERAKQEAQVIQRVAELRKEGLWSSKRLPRVQEPPRQKAHWDYLLEEMTWLAADFIQERKWKKAAARKVARMVSNYFKEQEQKGIKAEKEEATKLKKIASHMSKMVKEFWTNIEKVVQYKQQMRLDEKKKRALDLHLNFIVDQTEKYSSWLTEGLQGASSVNGSVSTSPSHSSDGDDFEPSGNSSDDEETIQKEEEEADGDDSDEKQELEALQKEGDLPLEELLKTLPPEVLDAPAPLPPPLMEEEVEPASDHNEEAGEEEEKEKEKEEKAEPDREKEGSDKEFAAEEEEAEDVEDTIDEQEKHEKRDYQSEIKDLEEEGEMSIEELAAKYAGAYDSDFEMPQQSSSEEEDEDDLDSDEFEIETGSSSGEEEEEKEEEEKGEKDKEEKEEGPGLEALMKPAQSAEASASAAAASTSQPQQGDGKMEQKDEVINDIAAQALSLQPKGYTLETTEVKTKVPFLLKHKLREYQHVGLDWLATMHEKHLNGILADEMGLGKTIQTIGLLAHLACEKGIWGPHLIVVPTSVMLNWEMELKKWCPAFKILTYYGTMKERKLKRQGWTKTNAFHVCITSYKLVVQDHQAFRRKKWKYLILDEAQNIKNFKSQRWQMLLNFSSQRRLLLTGTPLQNSLMELWSLMHFLMPNVFQSHRDFKEWFSNPLTGMIEGSQEYNESLIKRLHKVLRPFLLRRLKNEVEKQMPQKYEHVVMCRLSKRQRFLYDDFMSQAKTKETLASGHYMSVINILMQLRKVCNHPNLFDPRPVVSPLYTEGLVYNTASLVMRALDKDPLEEVDMATLFPNLVEMERDLPAFVAHRVKQLRTAPALIEEVDSQPDPSPRPPRGHLKPGAIPSLTTLVQTAGRASPVPQGRAGSPVEVVKGSQSRSATPPARPVAPAPSSLLSLPQTVPASSPAAAALSAITQVRTPGGQTLLLTSQPRSGASPALVLSTGAALVTATSTSAAASSAVTTTATTPGQPALQAKVLPQQTQGSSASATSVLPTQPITVQIQQTEQGTRLMIPTGQLSQLPASLFQIVQTSSGQQLIATSAPVSSSSVAGQVSSALPVTSTASSTVNGPSALTTLAVTCGQALVSTAISQLKTLTALSSTASTASASSSTAAAAVSSSSSSSTVTSSTASSSSSSSSSSSASSKPVMRVSPMVASSSSGVTVTTSSLPASVVSSVVSTLKSVMSPKKRSEFYHETVHEKRKQRRREKLKRLARINSHNCSLTPVYGPDLIQTLTFTSDVPSHCSRGRHWMVCGNANCQCVHSDHNRNLPQYYWRETSPLADMIHTPDSYLTELKEVLERFAMCVPSVISPGVQLRVAHPDPSSVVRHSRLDHCVRNKLRPLSMRLNDIHMRMSIQFPELRLIQYDCGKLQTLDVLLRELKSGSHRVLIFTQMTKMLDVLEAFLNYHGHRYLRLDGTTRVEQRQALMDRFNADKRIFCFILSTRSGGIGVNLTGADTVIFYDSDWNPTMDAQAQDRCHRIGQTRDVHIYRLISEMTVEENILKKANQKRLLGDLAIEGGNFTTAFFKEQTIKDLFAQPSGLQALAEQKAGKMEGGSKEKKEEEAEAAMEVEEAPAPTTKKEANIVAAFEQALCKAEDETDAIAANLVKAEQKAELADFDESIPWDEREAEAKKEQDEMSRAEMELAMLDKELSGIERYAVALMEAQMEDEVAEELKMAEEDIENSKKDWELARLKALKEEEERRARMEEDEMLYTYVRDDAQVKRRLAKAGKVKKGPGRPRIHHPPPPSPSLSTSDTGSVEARPAPSRVRNRVVVKKEPLPVGGRGRGRKKMGNGEAKAEVGRRKRGQAAKAAVKVENDKPVENGPTPKAPPKPRGRRNNIARKTIHNGEATPEEVKDANSKKDPQKVAVVRLNSDDATVKTGEGTPAPKGRGVGRPRGSGRPVGRPPGSSPATPRAILKVPSMATTQAGAGMGLTPPPRNKSPAAVTSPVSSPGNVPPPWSNPNLVIRTRRANLHSPVQVFISSLDGSEMPMWAPPTPPQDDNDVYVDQTMMFLYEQNIMSESQLPPVYVRKDHRKPRMETITTRKQKQRKEEAPRVPRSLFDRPNAAIVKMRREMKMQRLKAAGLTMPKQPMRPSTLPAPLSHKVPGTEQSEGHPEWLIHEDWALLQAVSELCHLPLNLTGYQNGHIPNWDLVADVVNGVSRTHRSIKQCKARYENVIIPREEGRILYDISPRKQKKNKSTYKAKNNRPMKTSQLYTQDNNSSISLLYSLRFDSVKSMAAKRPAPMRPTLNNPSLKNPKHLAVLQENNINYDQPLNPQQVAAIRAERIARDKKASAAAHTNATESAQRSAQACPTAAAERVAQGVVQAVTGVAASAPTVAQAVTGQQLHSLVSAAAATPTTIIAGTATPRAAVAQGMTAVSIARTIAATSNIVAVTGSLSRGQRVAAVHDITTVAGTVQGAQVAAQTAARAGLQPTASASANITQKMAAMAGTSALAGATVHQQLAKSLTHTGLNLLRPTLVRSQTPGAATQAQQLRAQKLNFKQGALVRTMSAQLSEEQLKAIKVRQLQNKASGGQQLQATQILQGQMQQVGQSGTSSAAPVTLVKSVAAPAVPIPVSINVTMAQGQQKAALPSRPMVSQLQHQRMQLLQQHRKGVPIQQSQRVAALTGAGVRSSHIPLIIPQKGQLTGQLLHQFVKQQQIISTSQPAIISVTQSQTLTPMVAKVSLTTVPHTTPIHTLSASPITVTQVAAATPSAGVSGTAGHHAPAVATINMAAVPAASHTATVVKTANLTSVEPSQQQAAAPKLATISQSLVAQPLQIAASTLSQQGAPGQTLVAAGTQHRVLTATPTTLPQATAVVVSTTALAQGQPSVTAVVQQQQQQQQQQQHATAQQLVTSPAVVSAQAVPSPSAIATVVTQTQSPQAQQSSVQLTAQQQLQKPSPYTMRTRNPPKHS